MLLRPHTATAGSSRWSLLLLLIVGCVGAAAAAGGEQQLLFSTKVEAVRVDVLVTDRGQPVRGLKAADFEVLDNDVLQQVDLVSFAEVPLNVILALDPGGS